ncbi:hypothetical protein [Halorubrum sp. Ea8]|uniref:hypothetical protein n=1 Tax=Halorubrum sp. Ea8 TaxID=1383841 RepID=UPI000B98B7FF|nr:hypothetical protein [Halorubrum sp. Ea8]OYR45866.1 hypothetical protein DJ74_15715 [Halorubrum sp. Ea8]
MSGSEVLYELPQFRDRLRSEGALRVSEAVEHDVSGVVYHHRGARVPGHEATFVWEGGRFSLEIDAVGDRHAWVVFEDDAGWDVFVGRLAGDPPFVAWMCDGEFETEEADLVSEKTEAIGYGRFSFGCYLHGESTWRQKARRASMSTAPFFLNRPDGRTVVPDGSATPDGAVPPELRGEDPPAHLGLQRVSIGHE